MSSRPKTIRSIPTCSAGLEPHGAQVTEVESSHVPMLSQPDVVIDVIRKASASAQSS
jgi:hypothetical protein